ncbi:RING-H2 finger protein ATL39-like [Impatiens glandulifera]|uniref:RING-H2 finger protein ATL39-like n=1 Tax=Impatiens glandulifera TaxID=253017 RepID=UPI001FB09F3F|nr:RING-H2 finger protein ATL39-like [Impatiens glandulifera]
MAMEILVSLVLLILGICILIIIHIIIVGRVFRGDSDIISSSETAAHRTNNRRRRRPSMAIDDIKKLPSFEFKLEEEEENGAAINGLMECAVCLETFKMLEICRLLPLCKHMFHLQCIDLWLAKTAACPICRTDVGLGDPIEVGDGLT